MKTRERLAQLRVLSKVYAEAKADQEYLKHFRKSKLAILKSKYLREDSRRSNAACDDLARSDNEYVQVLDGLRVAIATSEAAYWELTIARAGIQLFQTERADRRAELNNLNNVEG